MVAERFRKSKGLIVFIFSLLLSVLMFTLIGRKEQWPLWKYFPPIAVLCASLCFAMWKQPFFDKYSVLKFDGKSLWLHFLSYMLLCFGAGYVGGNFGDELWRYILGMVFIVGWSLIQRHVAKEALCQKKDEEDKPTP